MRSYLAAVVAIVAMSSVPAFADTQSETLQVFKEVQRQINYDTSFTIFDNVNVGIDETGRVTLTGSVTNPFKKSRIEDRVDDVDGVLAINNQIEVLPCVALRQPAAVSGRTRDLRTSIAGAVHQDAPLDSYRREAGARHPDWRGEQGRRRNGRALAGWTRRSLLGDERAKDQRRSRG